MRMLLRDNFPPDRPDNSLYSCNVALYELGELSKCLIYASHHHNAKQPTDERVYLAEGKVALCDLITQTRILAEQLGVDFNQCILIGEERFKERMEQIRNGHLH